MSDPDGLRLLATHLAKVKLEAAEQIGGGVTHNQGAELKASSVASTSIEASHTDH